MLNEHRSDAMTASPMQQGGQDRSSADVRSRVSAEEWEARVELAALYRLVAHYKWTDTIYTHISMRVPGEHTFLINAFGLLYEEITASSLVKIDVHGTVLDDPTGLGINRAGFVIHGAIHAARHDVACVIHTHTRAGAGVSAQEHGLLPISQHAAIFMGRLAYHEFEGIAVNEAEQERLVADLGDKRVMILRNHGLLAAGRNAGEAFYYLNTLERACEIQIAALAGGGRVRMISDESIQACSAVVDSVGSDFSRDWSAMMRLADRLGPDFRN
ncbi:class II aldolase/adducin family protein [Blastomonas sp. AAP53]|uniref:class II aldolase/adducin family protein n=1 Tax=Blastomonas sp. AAP53 TaxID=1248760 RepID=UPI0002DB1061|nr:class II aldolase/adducin family protein [Blastomonas sp. AAP53]